MIISLSLAAMATATQTDATTTERPAIVVTTESIPRPVVITNPSWKTAPEPTDADYPHLAAHLGIEGRVVVECKISTEGVPDCEVVSAAPEGLGFENIAITITERGRMNPRTVDGIPVESRIRLSLPFFPASPEAQSATVWEGPEPSPANLIAGMVAAQALGPNFLAAVPMEWGLDQIERERASVVEQWIYEMYIGGTNVKLLGQTFAMVLAKRGLTVMPAEQPWDWVSWDADFKNAFDNTITAETNFLALKARYCARYDCGSDANTP